MPEITIITEHFPLFADRASWAMNGYAMELGERLCLADATEAALATGRPAEYAPHTCLLDTVRSGGVAAVCLINGHPEMIWGVRRKGLLTSTGEVWALRSAEPEKYGLRFARESRRQLVDMVRLSGLSRFENVVHKSNRVAIRWLKWLGFRVDRKVGRNWLHFQATAEMLSDRNTTKEAAHGRGC
jgi:hypothetical protein